MTIDVSEAHPDEHGHWDVADIRALLHERDALRRQLTEVQANLSSMREGFILTDKELMSSVVTAVMNPVQHERDHAVLQLQRHILRVEEERDAREKEAEASSMDKLRMDWLDKTGREHGHALCHVKYDDFRYYVHQTYGNNVYRSAREEIDAALAAKGDV